MKRPSELALIKSISEQYVTYVLWRAATDLEIDGDFIRSIDHVMTVAGIFLKRRAVASAQNRLPIVFNQDEFALKHVNQLVLGCVPMTLARNPRYRPPCLHSCRIIAASTR